MIKTDNNFMLSEAKKARFKPNFFLQIIIFIGVVFVTMLILGLIVDIPVTIWLVSKTDFMDAVMEGDIQSAIGYASASPEWMLVLQLFATVVETTAAIIYCRFIEKRSLNSMGFIRKGAFKNYLKGYLVGAAMITASCLIAVITGNMSITVSASISVLSIIIFFIGYLIQGMAEETLVRGYFMVSLTNSLHNRYAAAIAVFVSSLAFSILHIFNPGFTFLAFINLVLSGIFFGTYILRTDNIWSACAAHSAWNFFQGNVLGVRVSGLTMQSSIFSATENGGSLISGGSFGLEGGLAVTIVEVIAILLVVLLPKKKAA